MSVDISGLPWDARVLDAQMGRYLSSSPSGLDPPTERTRSPMMGLGTRDLESRRKYCKVGAC